MPAKNSDGVGNTSTRPKRPSNCSERLRTKRGQCVRARDQFLQCGQHLAAVADTERETVLAREVRAELVAQPPIEQDGLGPALPGTQHVPIGEASAGDEAPVLAERGAPADEVGHVHVVRLESRPVQHRGHLDLAVDALLAQHRDTRPGA